MFESPDLVTVQRAAVVAAFAVAALAVYLLDRPSGRWSRRLRRRFVLGVPWGTLVSVVLVLAVYLFVQGGLRHWYAPVVLPFRAWSYFYPLGMVTAPFAHSGASHLVGNLVGTVTLAPLAEYAWGHFPRDRGSESFASWRTNPYVRAFVVFPAVVVVVGLVTSFFSLGPIIGFSGVVFAFAGASLVNYPFTTVVVLAAGRVVRVVYNALQNPTLTASGRPAYVSPWWADIAIQGHALGLFAGVLLGLYVVRRRDAADRPSASRLWAGTLLYAVSQSMWAVYWYRGGETYVLYRAVGVVLVVALSLLVVATVVASDRYLARDAFGGAFAIRRWQVGAACLVVAAAAISGPAVPYNLYAASDDDLPGQELSVRDYEVTYAEDVPNGMVAVFDVDAFGETTSVNASGVVVRSDRRGIWTTAATKGRLAFEGQVPVRLGGVGWRETVFAVRDGWVVADAKTAYRVGLVQNGTTRIVYLSDPVTAGPVVAGRNVSVVPSDEGYLLEVSADNRTLTGRLPAKNRTRTLGGLTFVREKQNLYVEHDETRLKIAKKETYKGRRN
jgi:membrane associated rhomboid family serine protease